MLAPAEASSNLARYDGVRYGPRVENGGGLVGMYTRTRSEGFGAEVKRRIMLGTYSLSSGYYDAYYGRAQRVRTKIAEDFRAAFARFDFVVTPTAPTVAFELGAKTADPLAMYLNDYCTVPMSLAGIPAISIPSGLSEGLPVGFQLAGPAFSENRILDAAFALEQAIGFDAQRGRSARMTRVRARHRPGDPRPARDERRRCSAAARCPSASRPNTLTCPVCLGLPGTLPLRQRAGDPLRADDRPRAGLRARAAVDLPPQELLLSRPAQGLPDQPVRRAAVPRRAPRRRAHPPRAPRGGRREARPRRRERAHPRLRRLGRGLQPRRHAAGRDRHRARRALAPRRRASG